MKGLPDNPRYPTEFVLRVNEIYHDLEGYEYENKHPEIFEDEVVRWQEIGKKLFLNRRQKNRVLDIGSGTGFVPLQIARYLKRGDIITCTDISANKLEICKKSIEAQKFECDFDFVKLDGKCIPLNSRGFDYITMNSVLHHIPDFGPFFVEVDRLLIPDGRLVICHEPNRLFYFHRFLLYNYKLLSIILHPKKTAKVVLRRLGLHKTARDIHRIVNRRGQVKGASNEIVEKVNMRLKEERMINAPLSYSEIMQVVDLHSPTAGGYWKERGIDVNSILRDYLPSYKFEYSETYNHLCKVSSRNRFTVWYDGILKKMFPINGANFLIVLKKLGRDRPVGVDQIRIAKRRGGLEEGLGSYRRVRM